MSKYVAITLGPIFDTLSRSSKPASLWAGSFMFSYLSKEICKSVVFRELCGEKDIVSPFYESDNELLNKNNGVGMFHDHIIFRYEAADMTAVLQAIYKAVENVAEAFELSYEFLKAYLNIFACSFEVEEKENVILKCSKMLDCMELSKRFIPIEKSSQLQALLEGEESNQNIKKIALNNLGIDKSEWQLLDESSNIKDLGKIAGSDNIKALKKSKYICLLRADGDNMSKIISQLSSKNDECRSFSETCFKYCDAVAAEVGSYGGVTIYSGGDDLLAIVPCENSKCETLFHLIQSINKIFNECFKTYIDNPHLEKKPSLSLGAFISYKSFPLYEAVDESAKLLFGISKEDGGKNCVTVNLQKHSGQSAQISIKNDALPDFIKLLEKANIHDKSEDDKSAQERERVFLSAGQKINMFKALFNCCTENNCINTFKNIFDSSFHLENSTDFFHKELPEFFAKNILSDKIKTISKDSSRAETLAGALRIVKFYTERGES